MKKKVILVISLIFLFLMIANQLVIGNTITSLSVSQPTNVSITILAVVPIISILNPKNQTYLANHTLLLNYTDTNADNLWYHIDSDNNITLTSFIYFNTSQGSHTLYLYANNSQGRAKQNVTFFANSTVLTISYDEYEGAKKGSSTDFLDYSFEEIQSLGNITSENTDYGKINFLETINLTDDENPADSSIDLDTNINLSFNRIEINSTALPNFNKQATLYLYGLTSTNPRILKDGSACSSAICTKESYSGGILKFNVTGFSVYSSEETPVSGTETPSTSGGGGGGRETIADFSIDEANIKINIEQGETKEKQIIIRNTGTNPLSMSLSSPKLNLIKISEESFSLKAGETKIINLKFEAKQDTIPDAYTDKLILKAAKIEKEITISLEIESGYPLFDIKLEIPKEFLYISPGKEIRVEGVLYNLGKIERVDVVLEFIIKDFENNIIIKEQETKAIEDEISFVKVLNIPEEIEYGSYNVYVKAIYQDKTAIASSWFSVSKQILPKKEYIIFITASFIIFAIMMYVLYEISRLRKAFKIKEDILIKEGLIKLKIIKRR